MPSLKRKRVLDGALAASLNLISRQSSSTNSLPSSIQDVVPFCSQSCLSSWIAQGFNTSSCQDSELSCLCSQYSNDGYTLGEGALACIENSCANYNQTTATNAYNICESQDHVSATHATLTVSNVLATSTASIVTATLTSSPTNAPASPTTPSGVLLGPSTSSSASTAVPTSTPKQPSMVLPIIGITAAAVASVALVIALICFVACCRKRKNKKSKKDTLKDKDSEKDLQRNDTFKYPVSSPTTQSTGPGIPFPPGNSPERSMRSDVAVIATLPSPPSNPHSGFGHSRDRVPPPLTGLSVNPTAERSILPEHAYYSPESFQRPYYAVSPPQQPYMTPQLATNNANPIQRHRESEMTLFEEDSRRSPQTAATQHFPIPPLAYHFQPPYVQGLQLRHELPAEPVQPPQSGRPRNHPPPRPLLQSTPSKHSPPRPLLQSMPMYQAPDDISDPSPPTSERNGRGSSDYPFYHANGRPDVSPLTPPQRTNQERSGHAYVATPPSYPRIAVGSPPVRHSSMKRKQSTRSTHSDAYQSDTDFEDEDDEDEETPENEDKQLSPVLESPMAGLRYPKVPRGSNQRVARISTHKPLQTPPLTRENTPSLASRSPRTPNQPSTRGIRPSPQINRMHSVSSTAGSPAPRSKRDPVSPDFCTVQPSPGTVFARMQGDAAVREIERRLDDPYASPRTIRSPSKITQVPRTPRSTPVLMQNPPSHRLNGPSLTSMASSHNDEDLRDIAHRAQAPQFSRTNSGYESDSSVATTAVHPYATRSQRPPLSSTTCSRGVAAPRPRNLTNPTTPNMVGMSPVQGRVVPRQVIARPGMEIVVKSPTWTPKLTPTRRGADLVLSVE